MGSHFISYSILDVDFALRLLAALQDVQLPVWVDKRDLHPGRWDSQIARAIDGCDSLLFVMTRDSVEDQSGCKLEIAYALSHNKPILPLLREPGVRLPYLLGDRQFVDFTGQFKAAVDELRGHLGWLASPQGRLQILQDRLQDAVREKRRLTAPGSREGTAVEAKIADLRQQIAELNEQIEHPRPTVDDPQEAIRRASARAYQREVLVREQRDVTIVNALPAPAAYFKDRVPETDLLLRFLRNDALRVAMVLGPEGSGKTAMATQLLKALAADEPPDGSPFDLRGIVTLRTGSGRPLTARTLLADLCRLLPEIIATRLEPLLADPGVGMERKTEEVLGEFRNGCTVVLLDGLDDLIDPETERLPDGELEEALKALLTAPAHSVKVIITSRMTPKGMSLVTPGRQTRISLDELDSPHAENLLRDMDADGALQLRAAPADLLEEARRRTGGNPHALEMLVAILANARPKSLRELLDETTQLLPDEALEALLGEAFSRLEPTSQRIMQALATFARPVPATAVDYLLAPYLSKLDSRSTLARLVGMRLTRKEGEQYFLPPANRDYAWSRIPKDESADRSHTVAPFMQSELLRRAAEWFQRARLPRSAWRRIEDLEPQLAEIDLRCRAGQYDEAASILRTIDSDYLLVWGHSAVVVDLCKRLQGRVGWPRWEQTMAGVFGDALRQRGQHDQAIAAYERALLLARELDDRPNEGVWLNSIGNCYAELGQTRRALGYNEQALVIARREAHPALERIALISMANRHAELGAMAAAGDEYEQALWSVRAAGDQSSTEAETLFNLGELYGRQGRVEAAEEHVEQALALARALDYRLVIGHCHACLAELLTDQGRLQEAVGRATAGAEVGEQISDPQLERYSKYRLAVAHLYSGALEAARAAIDAARRSGSGEDESVLALLGLVALRQENRGAAREAFTAAVEQARMADSYGEPGFAVLDAKALALSGLALIEGVDRLPDAVAAYRAARALTQAPGVVARALRLLDALVPADPSGLLVAARDAARGEKPDRPSANSHPAQSRGPTEVSPGSQPAV
jgi:tetratricopeptide (TPR) repeat protein